MGQRFARVMGWLCAFGCVVAAGAARAEPMDDGYFAPKLVLGVGGEVEVETTIVGFTGSGDDDLELSYGGGFQYVKPLHRYFALGGLLALRSWSSDAYSDADLDRNLLLDIDVVPMGRLPLGDGGIELYLAVPIGLALDFWGEDGISVGAGGNAVVTTDVNTGIGFALAVLVGARFQVAGGFGLFAELGYQLHSFSHEAQATSPLGTVDQDFDFALGQLALNAGVFFF